MKNTKKSIPVAKKILNRMYGSRISVSQKDPLGPPAQLSVHFRNKDPMRAKDRSFWVSMLGSTTYTKIEAKFEKGAKEHKCEFGEQTVEYLLNAIEEEAIDQLIYVSELRRRIKQRKMI